MKDTINKEKLDYKNNGRELLEIKNNSHCKYKIMDRSECVLDTTEERIHELNDRCEELYKRNAA